MDKSSSSETTNTPANTAGRPAGRPAALSGLGRLDRKMASHPGYPRAAPYFVFLAGLAAIGYARDWFPASYPVVYLLLNVVIVWLLWRYRKLTPELNVRFDWRAIPVGVFVLVTWIWLGLLTRNQAAISEVGFGEFHAQLWQWLMHPGSVAHPYPDAEAKSLFDGVSPAVGWASMSLRLLGMSIIVPLFEELFIRSLLLRMFHRGRRTLKGAAQVLIDMPVIGDALMHTRWAIRMEKDPVHFDDEFAATPLGVLSVFGVAASTLLFTIGHHPGDWPGAILCGVSYCLLLRVTREKGLGPVVWAHGITNALLWGYTIYYGDWQFL